MNKLPRVFANPINHDINNEQKSYRSDRNTNNQTSTVTLYDIDKILKNRSVFGAKVKVCINNNYLVKTIVSRVDDNIFTIDNEKINIKDISSIDVI